MFTIEIQEPFIGRAGLYLSRVLTLFAQWPWLKVYRETEDLEKSEVRYVTLRNTL